MTSTFKGGPYDGALILTEDVLHTMELGHPNHLRVARYINLRFAGYVA